MLVGTVDKFQGQEAPVAILSMAASSQSDVSRGMGFLLDRHRLNVAVSRGKHSAFVVRSQVLTDFAPRTPTELVALGAFLGLCANAVTTRVVDAPPRSSRPRPEPTRGWPAGDRGRGHTRPDCPIRLRSRAIPERFRRPSTTQGSVRQ